MDALLRLAVADPIGLVWRVVLSAGLLFLWGRVNALHERQAGLSESLAQIGNDLAGLRLELRGVARAQQIEELRRSLLGELRPMLQDAIALQVASRPRRGGKQVGIEFEGNATITGAVAGGGIGQITGGPDGGSSGK